MRRMGWSWRELQETPQNVLDHLLSIEAWVDRKGAADAAAGSD